MISTKTKLVSAVAMLLVAVIMMTSASFAWFTISTAPTVSNINVNMAATRNLEIAMHGDHHEPKPGDKDDVYAWGSTISFSGNPIVLDFPATATGDAIQSINYDPASGRVDRYVDVLNVASNSGVVLLGASIDGDSTADVTVAALFSVDIRSNMDGNVTVSVSGVDLEALVTGVAVTQNLKDAASVAVKTGSDDYTKVTSASAFTVPVTAGTVATVDIMVYFDGELITSADILSGAKIAGCGIQFTHSATMGTSGDGENFSKLTTSIPIQ